MALGIAVVLLLVLARGASAAPPANDNFADAEDLGAGFPVVTQTWSNVEATEESGEPFLLFTAGHSVWFRWEATSADVVTIDTCESEFPTSLYVFTGSGLNELTEVGRDSNSDGRFCLDADGVTFRPVSGTIYWIFIDGDGFHFPEAPAPKTQGSFKLKVSKTPSPPNDGFESPIVLNDPFSGGDFYSAYGDGFNWNATKEAGEPDHAGDPGGASVWYQWTPSASGHAEVGACVSFDVLLGLYTGNAVNALTPVALESRPVSCFVNFAAVAGTTYRIAVDGRLDIGSGLPAMTGFGIHASMSIPVKADVVDLGVPPDRIPPNTKIAKRVLKRQPPVFVFNFSSTEPDSTFQCKLDKRRFARCGSSRTFKHPKPGHHTLEVRAVDPSGNLDPSPAVAHFNVKRPKRSRAGNR